MLTWTGQAPKPRQEVGGLVVQPLWRVPKADDLGPPRWFAVVGGAMVGAFVLAGSWTVLKALDVAWLTWQRFW